MASITESATKSGERFFLIRVSHGGKQYQKRWYWPDTYSRKSAERQAQKEAALFESAVQSGEYLNRAERAEKAAQEAAELAKIRTFRQYVELVYMPTKELTIAEKSREVYQIFLDRHIFPVLGDTLLTEITPAMVKRLIADYQKSHAYKSVNLLYSILSGVFSMAFDDDSIAVNPMAKVKPPVRPKGEIQQNEADKAYSVEELAYILQCARNEPLPWQTFINLLADTGCRKGEALGLQWGDIDFQSGIISISRNLLYSTQKGVYIDTPKSGKSRTVDIGQGTMNLLRRLRQEQAKSCISKWVFAQAGSTEPMHPNTPTGYFRKFGEKYGIKNFHCHILRHTSASLAITSGADVVSVSKRLGHSTPSITLSVYAHASEESIRKAGQIVRDAVKTAGG